MSRSWVQECGSTMGTLDLAGQRWLRGHHGRGRRDRMKSKDMRLLNRREFNGLCVALGSFASPTRAAGLDAAAGAASTGAGRTAKFRDGTVVPALGQGSAGLGKGKHPLN